MDFTSYQTICLKCNDIWLKRMLWILIRICTFGKIYFSTDFTRISSYRIHIRYIPIDSFQSFSMKLNFVILISKDEAMFIEHINAKVSSLYSHFCRDNSNIAQLLSWILDKTYRERINHFDSKYTHIILQSKYYISNKNNNA